MTDRVYPSSKPNGHTKPTTTTGLPPPPTKTQPHTPSTTTTTRHPYRPNPTTTRRRRHPRRRCFCILCFYSILITTLLLLTATVAGCILYLLYHPHRPTFSIAALKISEFTLTTTSDDTTRLTSKLNLTISTKNPNKKITFFYNPISLTCLSQQTLIAKGSFPKPLTTSPNNITIIHSSLHANSLLLDTDTVNKLRSDLKKKSGLKLELFLDTEARVKIESLTTKKVGIRIKCEGIHSLIPRHGGRNSSATATETAVAATVSAAKCKLRIKIWKWTF